MTLTEFKWLAALLIFTVTLLTGLLSITFTARFRKQLEIGNAVASGIFIGAAIFHLLPEAIGGFKRLDSHLAYSNTLLLLMTGYLIFWIIERVLLCKEKTARHRVNVGILVTILSIHAAIAGLTLGISETLSLVSILFIAIIVHKGFETFAFIINIYRQIGRGWSLSLLLLLFAFITPSCILIGLLSNMIVQTHLDNVLTTYFSAIATGTFLYIGTVYSHHLQHPGHDSHHQYFRVVGTIVGVILMGILAIWI